METFVRKITPLEAEALKIETTEISRGRSKSADITTKAQHLLRPAHAEAVNLILRKLHLEGATKNEVQAAKKFLQTSGYNKKGEQIKDYGSAFFEALNLKEGNKLYLLEAIKKHAIASETKTRLPQRGWIRGNPLTHIAGIAEESQYFLQRDDTETLEKDIKNSSKLTEEQKRKLLAYLAGSD